MYKQLTAKEQEVYDIKLSNEFYFFDDNEDTSKNEANNLEKRTAFYNYINKKIDFLKKDIEFRENCILKIKDNLFNKFGKEKLSDKEISELDNSVLSSIPKYDQKLNKSQNEIVFEALNSCFYKDADIYNNLVISNKDYYLKAMETILKYEELISKNKLNISFLSEELKLFVPIEMKNGFYLFNDFSDYILLSDPFDGDFLLKEENIVFSKINSFNSIYLGDWFGDKKNRNPVANVIPDESLFTNEEKTFIATNGKGGRYGGLFKKEILASCKEEALLKLNNWAKENNSSSWSIWHMTRPCSGGFISIIEKQEEIIK